MRRIFIIFLPPLFLSGCGFAAAQIQKAEIQRAGSELKTCVVNVYNEPDYAPILAHLASPESNFQPTMAQLSDDTRPTKSESRLLIRYHDDLIPCRQAFLQRMQGAAPAAVQIFSEQWIESDKIMVKLLQRKITWGEAAQQRQQILLVAQKNLTTAAQTQMSLRAQQQAANAASSQASAAWFQATKPAPVQIPQPTTTNCRMIGNTFNCNSY